ncbi:MAG: LptF/LptG family permease [Chlamydiae bacterium]|nr:LptF/LptG family permease [Chlamydiota bacterium]
MTIIWHYITKTYLKIFALCLTTLFGLCFLIKHKKLTLLIVQGATYKQAFMLSLCMLSITLPHAIGLCSFLSSILTAYKLNTSGEVTSLRSSGLGLFKIFTPIYFAGAFLLLINIFLVSEFIPYAKLLLNKISIESQSVNPLLLLRKNEFPFLKNVYTEMNLASTGTEAENVLITYFHEDTKRIALFKARHLKYFHKNLEGENITLISHLPTGLEEFDNLIIDNQSKMLAPESFFTSLTQKPEKALDYDLYSTNSLLKTTRSSARAELFQRISKIIFPFTFTLFGISQGLVDRKKVTKGKFAFLFFSLFGYFACFFALKNRHISFSMALLYTLAPHLFILIASFFHQKKIVEGKI